MKVIITQEDFDNAIKCSWAVATCILAQTAKRLKIGNTFEPIPGSKLPGGYLEPFNSKEARRVRKEFDKYFNQPGDEDQPELIELRNSLPVELGDFDENQNY